MSVTHGWTSGATPDGSAVTPTNMNDHSITGDVDFASHKAVNVTDPSSPQDAATKAYVDANGAPPAVKAAALVTAYSLFR